MGTVDDILRAKGRNVWSISPDSMVLAAIGMMAEKEIGALVVMDGEKLAGIVTERDYARKVVLSGRSSKDTPVKDVMTTRVLCTRPEQTVNECMALMTDKRARHLPVLDHERVVGIVSIGDLVKAVINEQKFVIEQLQQYIVG
jgi:CBS domain-containing protein